MSLDLLIHDRSTDSKHMKVTDSAMSNLPPLGVPKAEAAASR
jgi:hypothetical protein